MTQISAPGTPALRGATGAPALRVAGATTTTDGVIATVAGLAARQVPGVADLGSDAQRALGPAGGLLPGDGWSAAPGVRVRVGGRQAAVEVSVVAELGHSVPEVASRVRAAVASALRDLVDLEVTAVDVAVVDVAVPPRSPRPAA